MIWLLSKPACEFLGKNPRSCCMSRNLTYAYAQSLKHTPQEHAQYVFAAVIVLMVKKVEITQIFFNLSTDKQNVHIHWNITPTGGTIQWSAAVSTRTCCNVDEPSNMMLSQSRQTPKAKYCIIPLKCPEQASPHRQEAD